jgi:hypothetical protein
VNLGKLVVYLIDLDGFRVELLRSAAEEWTLAPSLRVGRLHWKRPPGSDGPALIRLEIP